MRRLITTDGAEPRGAAVDPYRRPHDIPLDDVSPCSLLTPAQRIKLGVTDGQTAPGLCAWPRTGWAPNITYNALVRLDAGVDINAELASVQDATVVVVAGFPAVQQVPDPEVFVSSIKVPTTDRQHLEFIIEKMPRKELPPGEAAQLAIRLATPGHGDAATQVKPAPHPGLVAATSQVAPLN